MLLKECNLVQNDQIDSYMTRPNNTRAVKCSSIFLFITFANCNLLIGVDVRLLRLLIEIFNALAITHDIHKPTDRHKVEIIRNIKRSTTVRYPGACAKQHVGGLN